MTSDLEEKSRGRRNGTLHRFTIDAFRKQALLTGQDEIALTLGYERRSQFEARARTRRPSSGMTLSALIEA